MVNNNSISLLEEMKVAKYTSVTAFTDFVGCREQHFKSLFCFYEGEDGKYYNERIKRITGNEIIEIIVGDKNNVIKLWKRFKKEELYKKVHKMFFIDRDMYDIPDDIDEDLYITPCYSIENLYANEETFLKIIETEFMINKYDQDFYMCKNIFRKTFKEFCEQMIDFNGLVMIRKDKGLDHNDINFNDYKLNKLVDISTDGVSRKSSYNIIISQLLNKMNSSDNELEKCKETLRNNNDFAMDFRGKQQLDFIVNQINNLKKCNERGEKFSKKRNNIHINITKNRLSELSAYAITPECLKIFVLNHKLKEN